MRKIGMRDSLYPKMLREIGNAPEEIYVRGDVGIFEKVCISVVGTRKCSEYGRNVCKKIIKDLSNYDVCIVSGLALGIDTVAHEAALCFGLPTIAVLGSGINNIYPRENIDLSKRILSAGGAIVSEYEDMSSATRYTFPLRNRIISGMSDATIVIEAPMRSGALITAQKALDAGRCVFVVPADIDRVGSQGINRLIRDGKSLPIFSGFEVIDSLRMRSDLFSKLNSSKGISSDSVFGLEYKLSDIEKRVFGAISTLRALGISDIKKQVDIEIQELMSILSFLEIKGAVKLQNGKYVRAF